MNKLSPVVRLGIILLSLDVQRPLHTQLYLQLGLVLTLERCKNRPLRYAVRENVESAL